MVLSGPLTASFANCPSHDLSNGRRFDAVGYYLRKEKKIYFLRSHMLNTIIVGGRGEHWYYSDYASQRLQIDDIWPPRVLFPFYFIEV